MNDIVIKSIACGLPAMMISAVTVGIFSLIKKKCIDYLKRINIQKKKN